MIKTDPIRVSDYDHQRVVVFDPVDAARQFKISAFVAATVVVATVLTGIGMMLASTHDAQTPPVTAVAQAP